jgi:hypothetical protein
MVIHDALVGACGNIPLVRLYNEKSKPGGGDSLRSKPEGCAPWMARNNFHQLRLLFPEREAFVESFYLRTAKSTKQDDEA